jgi:predicted dithiol-disulfide oxidoreductase (DUF899 family)
MARQIFPQIVAPEEWLAAHTAHLAKEKQLTRARDELARQRRNLPWVKIEKTYVFDAPGGQRTLSELFDGRSQLIVKHFMFNPDWKEGCVGCSFECDHVDGARMHLEQHDVSYVAVSRAPLAQIESYKARMGWQFPWVSSFGSDFNYDFHVSFTKEQLVRGPVFYNFEARQFDHEEESGISVFFKDASGDVFHTFSAYGRGGEEVIGAYMYLDMTPKGRNETGPNYNLTDWVRHHDKYDKPGTRARRVEAVMRKSR